MGPVRINTQSESAEEGPARKSGHVGHVGRCAATLQKRGCQNQAPKCY